MRHFAANHILLLRKVTLTGILHSCGAHKGWSAPRSGCSDTLPLQFQTAPQAAFTFCRSAQCNYSIRLLRQNISRPERHGILSLIAHCRAAQDISRAFLQLRSISGCSGTLSAQKYRVRSRRTHLRLLHLFGGAGHFHSLFPSKKSTVSSTGRMSTSSSSVLI